jgi:hypothetical protein
MTPAEFLAQAWPDCPECHGTGLVEGAEQPTPSPDRICFCVPVLIIKARDDTV